MESELSELLNEHVDLETRLRQLSTFVPDLRLAKTDAEKLTSAIACTAKLAEGVSVKVKQLDLAKVIV